MSVDRDDVSGTMDPSRHAISTSDITREPTVDHYFIENRGQLPDEDILYYGATSSGYVSFQNDSVVLGLTSQELDAHRPSNNGMKTVDDVGSPFTSGSETKQTVNVVRLVFEDARDVVPIARTPLNGVHNYILGDDPSKWVIGVNRYSMVIYEDLYDGIDLVYRTDGGGLKYEFLVHASAEAEDILVRLEGHDGLEIDGGDLMISTKVGTIRDTGMDVFFGQKCRLLTE